MKFYNLNAVRISLALKWYFFTLEFEWSEEFIGLPWSVLFIILIWNNCSCISSQAEILEQGFFDRKLVIDSTF